MEEKAKEEELQRQKHEEELLTGTLKRCVQDNFGKKFLTQPLFQAV